MSLILKVCLSFSPLSFCRQKVKRLYDLGNGFRALILSYIPSYRWNLIYYMYNVLYVCKEYIYNFYEQNAPVFEFECDNNIYVIVKKCLYDCLF